MYTLTRGPSKLATQRRTGTARGAGWEVGGSRTAGRPLRSAPPGPDAATPPLPPLPPAGSTQQPVESKVGEPRGRLQPGAWSPASPAQRLIFNRVNSKRSQVLLLDTSAPKESYTAAHEENVRFVYEAWQEVEQQLDGEQRAESAHGPVQYVEKTPNPRLKDFVPIDLEEWWANQFLAKV